MIKSGGLTGGLERNNYWVWKVKACGSPSGLPLSNRALKGCSKCGLYPGLVDGRCVLGTLLGPSIVPGLGGVRLLG